jgi:hypothetical protein
MFPRLLNLRPVLLEVLASSNARRCVLPLVVTKVHLSYVSLPFLIPLCRERIRRC